ncbi:MAG: winged helix-turn-helix transcriptional regulator [Anaerolineae bacterium]|nr:winged helix-turn-helix transcriptional regulator [Anaerolineae bacterium]
MGDAELRALRNYLRALGDMVRLQLLHLLCVEGEMNVTDLAHALRISQPLVSWHLGVLRRARLVSIRRKGRQVLYSPDRSTLRGYRARLDAWLGDRECDAGHEEDGDD